jgi:hypothetical protein
MELELKQHCNWDIVLFDLVLLKHLVSGHIACS